MRYYGMRAHVKKQYPDVVLPRGFSRTLNERYVNTQNGETCSCEYYNFLSFLINNCIIIEKIKKFN